MRESERGGRGLRNHAESVDILHRAEVRDGSDPDASQRLLRPGAWNISGDKMHRHSNRQFLFSIQSLIAGTAFALLSGSGVNAHAQQGTPWPAAGAVTQPFQNASAWSADPSPTTGFLPATQARAPMAVAARPNSLCAWNSIGTSGIH